MPNNPWQEFENPNYRIEDLGGPAVFLLPANKLERNYIGKATIKDVLHDFLYGYFGSFTTTLILSSGLYRKYKGTVIHDACYQYEVAFVGKDRIGLLMSQLAVIAVRMEEECIYFKAGENACLIYPR